MKRTLAAVAFLLGLISHLSCQGGARKAVSPKDLWVITSPSGQITGPLRVEVVFSQPMVAPEDIGPTESPPLKITPPVEGEARWVDDRTLVFIANETLPAATEFTASVPSGVLALDGHRLGEDHQFSFSTARLTAELDIDGYERFATRDQAIIVRFNQRVGFDALAKNCRYAAGNQTRTLKEANTESGPSKTMRVQPSAPLTADTDWVFECTAALTGNEGNLGLAGDIKLEFHTHGPLAFERGDPSGSDVDPEPASIELAFSNPLKEPYAMTISPKVRGFPERCYSSGRDSPGLECNINLEPQTNYTINISGEQSDVFGQTLGAAKALSFRTGDAGPGVSVESGYFVAELRRTVLPVWTRNAKTLKVTAAKVTPKNFTKVRSKIDWWDTDAADLQKIRGLKKISTSINVAGVKNKWRQHAVDPAKLLGRRSGPGMYYIEIGTDDVDDHPFYKNGRQKVLVNFTDIGVVSKLSATRGLVWVTRLSTGKPLVGARVFVQDGRGKVTWTGRTGAGGIATLPSLKRLAPQRRGAASDDWAERQTRINLFVSHKSDFTMVNAKSAGGLSAWNFNVSTDYSTAESKLRGFMHTDRGLYRPGEKVSVKGLARSSRLGSKLAVPRSRKVSVEVDGPRGKTFHTVETKLSRFGGFWFDLELPGDARLGDYTIRAKLADGTFSRRFAVEEYRPATFEVTGKTSASRIVHRGRVDAVVEAKYLYGAPLRSGKADIVVYQRPRTVRFPTHKNFSFADERSDDRYHDASSYSQELVTEDSVALDKNGRGSVSVNVGPADMTKDADLLVSAQVASPSGELVSKSFTIPYFRSKRYFGIKAPGYFIETGKKQRFDLISVAPDGKRIGGKATVRVERRDWNCVWEDWGYRGSYRCKDIKQSILKKEVTFSSSQATPLTFVAKGGGEYSIIVESKSAKHTAAMELYAWGSDGGSWRSDDGLSFDIVADKSEYRAGETANLILKTDLAKATGLVTIERDGVIERRFVEVDSKNKRISIPISKDHAPNVYVSVALVQGRMGKGRRGKPRMKMGMVNLPVRPDGNKLNIAVTTDESDYRPGGEVTARIKVTDANGRPVKAEVSLAAADEGVLSLIAYKTPNPIPTFYSPWGLGVTTATQFAFIRDIPGPNKSRPATGGDSAGPGSVRSRFMSTAEWQPGLQTNSAGIARATFKAPDNLTAFRVMAVAADAGYRFGSGDVRFTVSKPLQLHRFLPRFLTEGDDLDGGVVVHNETKKAGTAKVTIQTNTALAVRGQKTRSVKVPAGGRVPVLWDILAVSPGDAQLTFSVELNGENDAVRFELPVHHPGPERRLLVKAGETKAAESVTIALPKGALAPTARVHVSVDPDGLSGIEDGLRDLIGYPYGCLEQTTSKVIPMIAVRSLVESLNIKGLSASQIDGFVTAGIAKIGRHQTAYGGFSLWQGGTAERYYTAYALFGLAQAKKAGYKVDQTRIADGLRFLKQPVRKKNDSYRSHAGELGSQAFALYVRAELGDKDTAAATRLLASKDSMPLYGRAFVARALAAGLGKSDPAVTKLVTELASVASEAARAGKLIDEPKGDELYYYMSDAMRTTAIVLGALVELDPKNASIAPLAKTLMKKRQATRYKSTQANIYSLLALDAYAASRKKAVAPQVTVALGSASILKNRKLAGASRIGLGQAALPAAGETLVITPKGNVHYSVEVRYREKPSELAAESNKLSVRREYLDEAGKRKTTFKMGDVVTVRLTMTGTKRASHLMLSDRLPAGFEALNTRFATTANSVRKPRRSYWGGTRELRDERVDFATEYNWDASYVREYQMRAIASGTFAVPPTVSELMYEPEKNARTALGKIVVSKK